MTPRSLWNGTLAFGEVAIPVKLFAATASHERLGDKVTVKVSERAGESHRLWVEPAAGCVSFAHLARPLHPPFAGEPCTAGRTRRLPPNARAVRSPARPRPFGGGDVSRPHPREASP
jgi:hypothetical protein